MKNLTSLIICLLFASTGFAQVLETIKYDDGIAQTATLENIQNLELMYRHIDTNNTLAPVAYNFYFEDNTNPTPDEYERTGSVPSTMSTDNVYIDGVKVRSGGLGKFEFSFAAGNFATINITPNRLTTGRFDINVMQYDFSRKGITIQSAGLACDTFKLVIADSSFDADENIFVQYIYDGSEYVEELTSSNNYTAKVPRDLNASSNKISYFVFSSTLSHSDLTITGNVAEYDTLEVRLAAINFPSFHYQHFDFPTLSNAYSFINDEEHCNTSTDAIELSCSSWPDSTYLEITNTTSGSSTTYQKQETNGLSGNATFNLPIVQNDDNTFTLTVKDSGFCNTIYSEDVVKNEGNIPVPNNTFTSDDELCFDHGTGSNISLVMNTNLSGADSIYQLYGYSAGTNLPTTFADTKVNTNLNVNETYTNSTTSIHYLYIETRAKEGTCWSTTSDFDTVIFYPALQQPVITFADSAFCSGTQYVVGMKDMSSLSSFITDFELIEDPNKTTNPSHSITAKAPHIDSFNVTITSSNNNIQNVHLQGKSIGFNNCESEPVQVTYKATRYPTVSSDVNQSLALCNGSALNIELDALNNSQFRSYFTQPSSGTIGGLPGGEVTGADLNISSVTNNSNSNSRIFGIKSVAQRLGCLSDTFEHTVKVMPQSINVSISATKDPVCSNEELQFTASSFLDNSNNPNLDIELDGQPTDPSGELSRNGSQSAFTGTTFKDRLVNPSQATQTATYKFTVTYDSAGLTCNYADEQVSIGVRPRIERPQITFADSALCSGQNHIITLQDTSGFAIPNMTFENVNSSVVNGPLTITHIEETSPPSTSMWNAQVSVPSTNKAVGRIRVVFRTVGFDNCRSSNTPIEISATKIPSINTDLTSDTVCNESVLDINLSTDAGMSGVWFNTRFGPANGNITGIPFGSEIKHKDVGPYNMENTGNSFTQNFDVFSRATRLGCSSQEIKRTPVVLPHLNTTLTGDDDICSEEEMTISFRNQLNTAQNLSYNYRLDNFSLPQAGSVTRINQKDEDDDLSFTETLRNNTNDKQTVEYTFKANYSNRCFYSDDLTWEVTVKPWVEFSDPPYVLGEDEVCENSGVFFIINETEPGGNYTWTTSSDVIVTQDASINGGISAHLQFLKSGTEIIRISGSNPSFCSQETQFTVNVNEKIEDFDVLKIQNVPHDMLVVNLNEYDSIKWGTFDKANVETRSDFLSTFQTLAVDNFDPDNYFYFAEIFDGNCKSMNFYNYGALAGLRGLDHRLIQVYPNPSRNVVHLVWKENGLVKGGEIRNALGQHVDCEFIDSGGEIIIDVGHLATGAYFGSVMLDQTMYHFKFIKQ